MLSPAPCGVVACLQALHALHSRLKDEYEREVASYCQQVRDLRAEVRRLGGTPSNVSDKIITAGLQTKSAAFTSNFLTLPSRDDDAASSVADSEAPSQCSSAGSTSRVVAPLSVASTAGTRARLVARKNKKVAVREMCPEGRPDEDDAEDDARTMVSTRSEVWDSGAMAELEDVVPSTDLLTRLFEVMGRVAPQEQSSARARREKKALRKAGAAARANTLSTKSVSSSAASAVSTADTDARITQLEQINEVPQAEVEETGPPISEEKTEVESF